MNKLLRVRLIQMKWLSQLIVSLSTLMLSLSLLAAEPVLEFLSPPVSKNSSLSRLTSDAEGVVFLSWVNQENTVPSLEYSQLKKGLWEPSKVISSGSDWFLNWADFPALSVNQGNISAHWLQMSAEGTYDYDIKARFYNASKNEWTAAATLHSDGVNAEHGFVSMLPLNQGQTLISWLDGRQTKNVAGNSAMTLRTGIFDKNGNVESEWELDSRVCDCCQTSSALTAKGPVVVYRDRTENEIRDIYFTRYSEGQWSEPRAVFNDDWEIAGCPVNGPAAAAKDDLLAVSWFNAKNDTPEVKLVLSHDNGDSFTDPIHVAGPATIGRVGTTVLESGNVAVSWIHSENREARLMLSLYSIDGALVDLTEVAKISGSRRSGFPTIESVGDSIYLSWTDVFDMPKVRVAKITYPTD
ncbi:MAG: hypothetical protein AB8B95_15535 [Pseudohongiellaceae bacterium]